MMNKLRWAINQKSKNTKKSHLWMSHKNNTAISHCTQVASESELIDEDDKYPRCKVCIKKYGI